MLKFLFANATGGATFTPQAMGECEPDADNMQIIGVGCGRDADEAWGELVSRYPHIAGQWRGETLVVWNVMEMQNFSPEGWFD